jgi:hypothetical protein
VVSITSAGFNKGSAGSLLYIKLALCREKEEIDKGARWRVASSQGVLSRQAK